MRSLAPGLVALGLIGLVFGLDHLRAYLPRDAAPAAAGAPGVLGTPRPTPTPAHVVEYLRRQAALQARNAHARTLWRALSADPAITAYLAGYRTPPGTARDAEATIIFVLRPRWHYEPKGVRLQFAQALWLAWVKAHAPYAKHPHAEARIELVDEMGNELGGSSPLWGVWVED